MTPQEVLVTISEILTSDLTDEKKVAMIMCCLEMNKTSLLANVAS